MFSTSTHVRAILQALFVTLLWSTSWVFIKIGLEDIPPLTFAGLRYVLAFLALFIVAKRSNALVPVEDFERRDWLQLGILGIVFYALTQGSMFLALDYLPSVTLSLLLNFTTAAVALLGILTIAEYPSRRQWIGMGVYLFGVVVYFFPIELPEKQVLGVVIGLVTVFANAGSAVLGRSINRTGKQSALTVTVVSMGIGSIALLLTGFIVQGMPSLTFENWLIIGWLAVVNTAFAFTLWNHTLRELSAVESSVINNTMLIQIAILAWIFLDETITQQEIIGMILAAIGTLIVQVSAVRPKSD